MSLRPITPLATFNVSARLRNPLDNARPFTIGGAAVAVSDLAALDEFAVRVLQPFADAGFPVEVYSITAYGPRTATIVLPLDTTTDDRKRHELTHAENVLDVLARRSGRRLSLLVVPWPVHERRPTTVAAIVNIRRNLRAGMVAA